MEELISLLSIRDELTKHSNNILLHDKRIVLPKNLQDRAIPIAHDRHQGITRTKSFLRSRCGFHILATGSNTV